MTLFLWVSFFSPRQHKFHEYTHSYRQLWESLFTVIHRHSSGRALSEQCKVTHPVCVTLWPLAPPSPWLPLLPRLNPYCNTSALTPIHLDRPSLSGLPVLAIACRAMYPALHPPPPQTALPPSTSSGPLQHQQERNKLSFPSHTSEDALLWEMLLGQSCRHIATTSERVKENSETQ